MPFQDPSIKFLDGAFSPSRISGNVFALPAWTVTEKHRSVAQAMTTQERLLAEIGDSAPIVLGLIIFVFAFRWFVMKGLTSIGRAILPIPEGSIMHRGKELTPKKQMARTLLRFENSTWEMVFYTISASCGFWVYYNEEWSLWPTSNIWVEWPLQPMGSLFRGYYLLGLAFYSQALISLVFFDEPRSDYWEYMIHHLVTIFLIAVSYYTRIQRYGLIILFLHDFGDIWLNLAKTFQYLGPKWDLVCTLLFVWFVLVFIVTRMLFLPFTVIPSGYWEAMQVEPAIPGFSPMNIALVALQCLHCFWFYCILVAVYAKVVTGEMRDSREEDQKFKKEE